jgi:hypothetical protein
MGAKGGRRRAVYNPSNLEPFTTPKNAADLFPLLAQTLVEVRSGKMDPKVANSIAVLSAACLNALETAETESRLQALEAKLGTNQPGARPPRLQ